MKLPWGKHRGKDIEDIDSGYLKWLAENCKDEEICQAADEEYQFREKWNTHKWENR